MPDRSKNLPAVMVPSLRVLDSDATEISIQQSLHEAIRRDGRDVIRPKMRTEQDIALFEIASGVLADDSNRLGFSYTGFCLIGLPHKRQTEDRVWVRHGHNVALEIQPGWRYDATVGKIVPFGVPYGSYARLILIYLQTEALRTGSPEISLGSSMRDWMTRMGLAVGGKTARMLREQAARISACTLKFIWTNENHSAWNRAAIVSGGLQFHIPGDEVGQTALWEDKVQLERTFFERLQDHPVPFSEAAIRQLRDRSLSMDIYIWLAYRCHILTGPMAISWTAMHNQFGSGFKAMKDFRPDFIVALAHALAAYPDARVDTDKRGIIVYPAPAPVEKLPT